MNWYIPQHYKSSQNYAGQMNSVTFKMTIAYSTAKEKCIFKTKLIVDIFYLKTKF